MIYDISWFLEQMNCSIKYLLVKLGPIRLNIVYGFDFKLGFDIRIIILRIKLKQYKRGDFYKMWL
jgi:hypothetical protein